MSDPNRAEAAADPVLTSPEPSQPESVTATPAFLPLNDRLLVRRLDPEQATKFAQFTIPDAIKEKGTVCEVVAVSLGRLLDSGRLIPSLLAPGDHILVGKYAGTEVKLDGVEYMTLREEEVQGVVGGVSEERLAQWKLHVYPLLVTQTRGSFDLNAPQPVNLFPQS